MKSYLHYEETELIRRKALVTASEIENQPKVWRKLAGVLEQNQSQIDAFMKKMRSISNLRIIFTGAGSSAFIGESVAMLLQRETGLHSECIHTTDIVATPDAVLYDVPTLLVSYSRSGSSPESVGAIECAKQYVSELYNMVLVCNKDSKLAQMDLDGNRNIVLNLPQEASDMGFAMTCSVSSMMLTTWYVFGGGSSESRLQSILRLADAVEKSILPMDKSAKAIAASGYERIVYLGLGALRGLAHEGAIKSQELTAGQVVATYDTPTGFRHGPKTVINSKTLTVHLISPVLRARMYDMDLLDEINAERAGNQTVAVVAAEYAAQIKANAVVSYDTVPNLEDKEICAYLFGLLFIQLLSFEKSMALGITTDNPCPKGDVNRVVQGVKLHIVI